MTTEAEQKKAKELAMAGRDQESQIQKMQEAQQKKAEMEEQKRVMIRQLLEPDALERLTRIGLVKPEKQQQVEAIILQMAQSGKIQEKISDTALVNFVKKVEEATAPAVSTVKFQRKKRDDDDDDIDWDNM